MTDILNSNGLLVIFGLVVAAMVAFGSYAWWPKGKKRGGRRDYRDGEENYLPNDGRRATTHPQSEQPSEVTGRQEGFDDLRPGRMERGDRPGKTA